LARCSLYVLSSLRNIKQAQAASVEDASALKLPDVEESFEHPVPN
jgi:hypothetical protein